MASSTGDRRSYSRRAQYGAFAGYVIAIIGTLLSLMSVLLWAVDPVGFTNLRLAVAEATAPVARLFDVAGDGVSNGDDTVAAWWRAGSQNRALNARVTDLQRKVIRAEGLESENAELRRLLGLTRGELRPVATAQLIGSTASRTRRFALIDAGYNDGVRSGQPVRSADGLVGRTLEVGPSVSRVLLITDQKSVVPARRARDGLPLIVTGRGDALLDVRPLNAASNPLRVGDIIHTSGAGGQYQPRTPIGIVVRLTSDGGLLRLIADPGVVSGVIVEPAANADIVEPPMTPESATPGTAPAP